MVQETSILSNLRRARTTQMKDVMRIKKLDEAKLLAQFKLIEQTVASWSPVDQWDMFVSIGVPNAPTKVDTSR